LILKKSEVVFVKYTERACGARVDFQKIEGLFLQKKPWFAQSGLSACPIERLQKAGDVAMLAGQLLEAGFIWKRYGSLGCL
jgi:hypothetical protein